MVDETWTAKLYLSLRLKEDPHTRELCDVARRNRTHQDQDRVKRRGTRWARRSQSGGVPEEHREIAHPRQGQKEREARKAKEEVVTNIAKRSVANGIENM